MNSGIYKIYCSSNNKTYVGSSIRVTTRLREHRYSLRDGIAINSYMQSSWNLYGEDAFTFELLELCEVDLLLQREDCWIRLLNTLAPNGFNMKTAERPVFTDVYRKKLSDTNHNKGKKLTDDVKDKMRNSHKGKKFSDEHKKKLRDSWAKKRADSSKTIKPTLTKEELKQKRADRLTQTRQEKPDVWNSPEHGRKISDSLKGRKFSDEHRQKLSESNRKRKISDETRKKMSDKRKGKSCFKKSVIIEEEDHTISLLTASN